MTSGIVKLIQDNAWEIPRILHRTRLNFRITLSRCTAILQDRNNLWLKELI